MKLYGIVGAGGFGREVMPLVEAMLKSELANTRYDTVFIDEDVTKKSVNGHLVMSFDEFFAHTATEKFFNIAITNFKVRKKFAELLISKNIKPFSIRAFNNLDLSHNEIGEGAILCPFTILTANTKIGKFFHANLYSYIAHDCVIGDYVTFAPNVQCNGGVIIKDHAYIGTGVIIKQSTPEKPIIIGEGAILGMGAVVTKSVADYQTVVGNPARKLEPSNNKSAETQD